MRTIIVLNPKGGCGKSTIVSNIASYYAAQNKNVLIADYDPQGSSLDWLKTRPDNRTKIEGVAAWKDNYRPPKSTDYVIIDVPAGIQGRKLSGLIRGVQSVLIPVLPSPLDIRAAAQFIHNLLLIGKVVRQELKPAVIANRVRENTLIFHTLENFLKKLDVPFVATLRDTQNYIRASENGLGIFEMAPSSVAQDLEQWKPLTRWLNSKRSLP